MVVAAACVGAGVSGSSTFTTSHCLLWPQQAWRHPRANKSIRSRGGMATAAMSSNLGAVATTSLAEGIRVVEGNGGLPLVKLTSPHGSEAEIYIFGGCITSWRVPNGKDLLFVRPDAVFDKKKPISGGIPHCFPQFGPGPMQQHGFARNMDWSIAGSDNVEGDPVVTLELKDGPYSRAMWDFSFQALYKVTINAKSLSTVLTVTNTDDKPFAFSNALHTYFRASIKDVSVKGLKGRKILNKDPDPSNPSEGVEERSIFIPIRHFYNIVLGKMKHFHSCQGRHLGAKVPLKWQGAALPFSGPERRPRQAPRCTRRPAWVSHCSLSLSPPSPHPPPPHTQSHSRTHSHPQNLDPKDKMDLLQSHTLTHKILIQKTKWVYLAGTILRCLVSLKTWRIQHGCVRVVTPRLFCRDCRRKNPCVIIKKGTTSI